MSESSNSSFPGIDSDAFNLFEVPNATGTPERRLLLAILERAILDFVGNDEKELAEAQDWLFDDFEGDGPAYSFPWLCQELDLHTPEILEKIKAMPRRGHHRIAPWYFSKAS